MSATYLKVLKVCERVTEREREKARGIRFTRHCIWDLQRTSKQQKCSFFYKNVIKHVFWDKPYVGNLPKGLESVNESNGERKKVKWIRFSGCCVSDALIFDLRNNKNVHFLCINAIKHDFWDKPYVGNLSKCLECVRESDEEREKVIGITKC